MFIIIYRNEGEKLTIIDDLSIIFNLNFYVNPFFFQFMVSFKRKQQNANLSKATDSPYAIAIATTKKR